MDGWDFVLLVVAGYAALMALVRLMIRRRNQLVQELLTKAEQEQQRKQAKDSKKKPAQRQGKAA